MTKAIFITATGTDVGKTYISALIVKMMRERGFNCGYYKPVLSGAEVVDGVLDPGDCSYVLKSAGIKSNPCEYVSYIFKPAVSPHLASQIENNPIKIEKILTDFEKIKNEFEYVVVEGAGGITCPLRIDDKIILLSDLIKRLGLSIVIVASSGLGTLNSTLLTAEYAKFNHINVHGIILNRYDGDDFMQKDNRLQMERLTGLKILAEAQNAAAELKFNDTEVEKLFKEII